MKISLNWLNDYVDVKKENPRLIADKITKAGVNIEGIETCNLDTLIVGYVESMKPHPESDHLQICMVNIGQETLQIICGAPNINQDQKVIVAPIGTTLPGDFVIKKVAIRGVESNGMICALFELGLEDKATNYDKGIHVLGDEAEIGSNPLPYLGLDDTIYDLDLNPNRNDCLSYLGFAYEAAAVLDKTVKMPGTQTNPIIESVKDQLALDVQTELCPMYQAKMVKDVVIGESPSFIKERLITAGIRPINNVVDISNYIMLEYGQPLHFFDKDKLGNKIVVRMACDNEKTITLDDKERTLTTDDIVITNDNEVVAIAGVMGCANSEVDNNTKNILIESAIFKPYNVRYTSIRLALRSEASLRFEKGLNYEYTSEALERACYLLEQYASGKVLNDKVCYDAINKTPKVASISKDKINAILGMTLTHNDIMESFRRLDFPVDEQDEIYTVTIPNRRMDVVIGQDLVEEVGRLYSYDKIVGKLPVTAIKAGTYAPKTLFRKDISRRMRALGLNEAKTYTLISNEEAALFKYNHKDNISLQLPMSSDKSIIRQTILPSLLKVLDYNMARNIKDINIYEISNTYYQDETNYNEELKLSLVMYGDYIINAWQNNHIKVDFYVVKGIIENLLNYLGYSNRYTFQTSSNLPTEIHPGMSAEILIDNQPVGYIGKIHPQVNKLDIYLGELNLDKIFAKPTKKLKYQEVSKYPSISKDVAFVLDKQIEVQEVLKVIKKAGSKLLTNIDIFDVYEGNNIDLDKKSIAFNLTFTNAEKTLTDEEVNVTFNNIIDEVSNTLKASVRNK